MSGIGKNFGGKLIKMMELEDRGWLEYMNEKEYKKMMGL